MVYLSVIQISLDFYYCYDEINLYSLYVLCYEVILILVLQMILCVILMENKCKFYLSYEINVVVFVIYLYIYKFIIKTILNKWFIVTLLQTNLFYLKKISL